MLILKKKKIVLNTNINSTIYVLKIPQRRGLELNFEVWAKSITEHPKNVNNRAIYIVNYVLNILLTKITFKIDSPHIMKLLLKLKH